MLSREEIFARVSTTLVEALNVDDDDIQPTSRLQDDLGAESIDFLDIIFRLEREFGIEISRDELFPESIFRGDPEFVQDGRVTEKGIAELHTRMPFADMSQFEQDPRISTINDLFTVDLITRYVERKLAEAEAGMDGTAQQPSFAEAPRSSVSTQVARPQELFSGLEE